MNNTADLNKKPLTFEDLKLGETFVFVSTKERVNIKVGKLSRVYVDSRGSLHLCQSTPLAVLVKRADGSGNVRPKEMQDPQFPC